MMAALRRCLEFDGTLVAEIRASTQMSAEGLRRRRHLGQFESLVVADVDLDRRTAQLVPIWTAPSRAPQGIYAVIWFHGEPIGAVTVAGDPDEILETLPAKAAEELATAVLEHHVRDSLRLNGSLGSARPADLAAVPHPPVTGYDGSQITVAVCTRDRPEQLQDCLAAISRLDDHVAEVLLVDNAPSDGRTRQVAEQFPFVRYVCEPRAGLDWARNRALLEAATPLVAFTDDDAIVHPRWIAGLMRTFSEEPDAVVVCGLVVPAELSTPAQLEFERAGGFNRGFRRRYFTVDITGGEVAAGRYPGTGDVGTGANMAVRRETALALGGFDPALDVGTRTGGGGDLEFYFRALSAGHLVVYEPQAVVRHRHRRSAADLVRQRRGDGTGSYSIFVGAGRRYGPVQYRAFRRFAIRWALRHHLVTHVRSLMRPDLWPSRLVRAESRGAAAAWMKDYYGQAEAEAARRARQHPHEPTTPPLRRQPAPTPTRPRLQPVEVSCDLTDATSALQALTQQVPESDVLVEVTREGRAESRVVIRTAGRRLTPSRLAWELAAHIVDRAQPVSTSRLLARSARRTLRSFTLARDRPASQP